MKPVLSLVGLTALALGLLVSGSASGGGVLPSVVGSGDFTAAVPRHITITAVSGPEGVIGQITVKLTTTPATTIIADVTCLYVQGNRAVVGSVVTFDSTNPALIGAPVMHAFVDNGAASDPTPDQRSAPRFVTGGPPTQSDCESAFPTEFTTLFPIDPGNVTVNAGAA